jgi:hypothetical protein
VLCLNSFQGLHGDLFEGGRGGADVGLQGGAEKAKEGGEGEGVRLIRQKRRRLTEKLWSKAAQQGDVQVTLLHYKPYLAPIFSWDGGSQASASTQPIFNTSYQF